jgi:hypothetical protein
LRARFFAPVLALLVSSCGESEEDCYSRLEAELSIYQAQMEAWAKAPPSNSGLTRLEYLKFALSAAESQLVLISIKQEEALSVCDYFVSGAQVQRIPK